MVIAQSSGNEPWIFRASNPEELVGAHRALMAAAPAHGEPIEYLLYSPTWLGRGGPFGIEGVPASHAIAVTDRRFIVTRDTHDGSPPSTTDIPFDRILLIEKGAALLLGWLVIRFAQGDGRPQVITILHKTTGVHHFDQAIRRWRAALPSVDLVPSLPPDDHWKSVPRFLYYEIEPILLEGERLYASLHAAQRWETRQRFLLPPRHMFIQPWASAILAGRTIAAGIAEKSSDPMTLAFGANVTIVPYESIASASLAEMSVLGVLARELRIHLSRAGSTADVRIPFDGERDTGEAVAELLRRR